MAILLVTESDALKLQALCHIITSINSELYGALAFNNPILNFSEKFTPLKDSVSNSLYISDIFPQKKKLTDLAQVSYKRLDINFID